MPFTRMRLSVDDDEELDGQVKLMDVWAVDMRDSKQTSQMIAFIKKADRELESLKHLKRARRSLDPTTNEPKVTVLLAPTTTTLPILPEGTLKPYTVSVPRFGSSTPEQIPLKNAFWPTVYAPSQVTREPEWSKEGVEWVRRGIERVVGEARRAKSLGELPVACYVASPERPEISYLSTDTRISTAHPLRHAVINTIKTIAAALPPSDDPSGPAPTPATPPTAAEDLGPPKPPARNGEAYLLTNLTLFTTHEPCIMCTMALLHSRLKQIFFVYDMPRTGGCGGCAGVVGLRGVNHRFTVWKWTEKLSELDGGDLCVDESVDI
ncbi:hypothetical protein BOTBODRAFT_50868 [Botryobasidium botryosum FD-172 SS1]|uniref:CMP/dCMP-type deaminase domain-containing protein n=1 Tax=Botryobasidium botryosum (strain FD-172 SS1) TaxID=930990 RepID=A0A067N1L6_BOTB1|nr:hypothetical protein BOTBODRAFT_50868 [Botryobasidium botryosum FD-172 SS1]